MSVTFFFVKDFSATTWVRILKFGTRLVSDELYCVTKEQPHIAYQSLYLFIFLSLQCKFLSQISVNFFFVKDFSATTWVRILKFGTRLDSDVCLSVNFFFVKDFSATTWVRILKFGTRLDSDELYCVTKEQPHIAYQSLYLFILLSLQWKNFSSKISQQLLGLGF